MSEQNEKQDDGNEVTCYLSLVDRLRGTYTIPVDDGAGPLNGSDTFTRNFEGLPPINEKAAKAIESLIQQRDAAIKLLAKWCVAVETNGSGWDDWDEHYKDAMHRRTGLPEMRQLYDAAIKVERDR